jgi:ABC-type branched-subunit amino acid transport system substrate-binding protein
MHRRIAVLAIVLTWASVLPLGTPARAADPYRIGMSAAITGPAAGTYAPTFDAYKAYFKRLNAAGGINGHPVEIAYEDDRGEPSRAAANAKKFSDGVSAVVVASISATYRPLMIEAEFSKVPLVFGGGVCPKDAFPPAHPLMFCSTSFGAQWDSRFAVPFIKQRAGGQKIKLGFVAQNIPISQSEMEFAERLAREEGIETVPVVVVPGGSADLTPFASKLKDGGADWVLSWAPWPIEVGMFEALQRIGWRGSYLLYAHQQAQADLTRLKAPNLLAFGGNAMFTEGLPIHREIQDAVKGQTTHPADFMAEGWVSAMALEQALRKCGWPCSKERMAQALPTVVVDTKGLRGGPIEWGSDNHYRKTTYYKVYRWDTGKSAIVTVGDWTRLEVK